MRLLVEKSWLGVLDVEVCCLGNISAVVAHEFPLQERQAEVTIESPVLE